MIFITKLLKRYKKDKQKVKWFVDDTDKNTFFEHTETRLWRYANYIIIFLILLSVFLVMFETIWNNWEKYLYYIYFTDFVISFVFGIEYIYRFINSDDKKSFPFRITNILDLLSFLPFFIVTIVLGIGHYTIFALFRMFKVLKIFELFSHDPILLKLSKWIYKHKFEYLSAISVILIILVSFSTAIFYIENFFWNNEWFNSIPATLWWATVTMTTVGYWDLIPLTILWKFLAWILMFLWPVIIAILSAITIFVFLESTKLIEFWRLICSKCWTENAKRSNYCKHCANKLNNQ